jgi:hypothetical protein
MNTNWEKTLSLICCLNLLHTEYNDSLRLFTLHQEKDKVLSGPR